MIDYYDAMMNRSRGPREVSVVDSGGGVTYVTPTRPTTKFIRMMEEIDEELGYYVGNA